MISSKKARIIKKLICDGADNKIVYLKNVTSTNDHLRVLATKGADSGTVVIARSQSAGKGRKGKSFHSPSGSGIYLSYLYRPDKDIDTSIVTPMVAVAVYNAILEVTGIDTDIKWVNDLLLNGKKVSGILTEASVINTVAPFIVVGIGINVNTPHSEFLGELENIATSLSIENNEIYDIDLLIATIIEQLNLLFSDRLENVFQVYRRKCINIGKEIIFELDGEQKNGIAKDIDGQYRLIVELDGSTITLSSGIVTIRGKNGYC